MINYDLKKITTVVLDVDGVLSRSTIPMDTDGNPVRTLNIKDGYCIQFAIKAGLRIVIITGGKDESIRHRYEYLGMKDIFLSCARKIETYEKYCRENGIHDEEVIYIGDDIPDYEIMQRVGCPCCPKDAANEIKTVSTYISPVNGGDGCVRDILEQLLKAKGKWLHSAEAFGW